MGRRRGRGGGMGGRGGMRGRGGMGGRGRMGRRPMRRRRRRGRRLMMGGSILLMIGGAAAAYKLGQRDVERIEQQTGKSAESLTEDELHTAMKKLGIKQIELSEADQAAIDKADAEGDTAKSASSTDPMAQLRELGELRDAGILSEEEFAAKKTEILARL